MTPNDYLPIICVALPLVTMAVVVAVIVMNLKRTTQKGEG